jgi:hypothetical protein
MNSEKAICSRGAERDFGGLRAASPRGIPGGRIGLFAKRSQFRGGCGLCKVVHSRMSERGWAMLRGTRSCKTDGRDKLLIPIGLYVWKKPFVPRRGGIIRDFRCAELCTISISRARRARRAKQTHC